jgi:hypothetical protein
VRHYAGEYSHRLPTNYQDSNSMAEKLISKLLPLRHQADSLYADSSGLRNPDALADHQTSGNEERNRHQVE